MKLFIVAALIAVASAGRLEHLERSYLPPDHSGSQGSFARGSFGSQNSFGSNNFGASSKPAKLRTGSFGAATLNQYLPPDHGPSSGSGFNSFSSQGNFAAQSPSQQYGTPQFGSQGSSSFARSQPLTQGFGGHSQGFGGHSQGTGSHSQGFGGHSQGSNHGSQFSHSHGGQEQFGASHSHDQFGQAPSSRHSAGQFGAASNGFGSSSAGFGSTGSFRSQGSQSQFGAASRQYLAPKTSSFQNIPQQSFDEETGYHY